MCIRDRDGTANGKFIGLVTDKDYRLSRDDRNAPIDNLMTPKDKTVWAVSYTHLDVYKRQV